MYENLLCMKMKTCHVLKLVMYKKNDRAIGYLFHTNGDEHHRDDKKASYLFQKIYLANIFSIYLAPLIS